MMDGTAEELDLGKLAHTASVDEEDPEGEDGIEECDTAVVEGEEEPARMGGVLEEKAKAEAALGKSLVMVKFQHLVVKVITEKAGNYQNVAQRAKFSPDGEWEKVDTYKVS